MKKTLTFLFVSFLFIGFASQSNAIEVYKKGDTVLNLGFKGQLWFQSVEDAAPNGTNRSTDFAVKQFRLYTGGQVTQLVKFGGNIDFNDFGDVDGKKGSVSATLTDGWIGFNFAPEFQVMAGKFRAPFSRWALTDSYTGYPVPHSPFAAPASFVTNAGSYRQIGLTAWGMIGNKFRYNIGVADREPTGLGGENDPKDRLQYLFRVEFSPIGEDKAYVHSGQWLGKKKELVTLGAGYTTKKYDRIVGAGEDVRTYNAWTVDAYAEFPLPGGSAITGEAAYYLYDKDTPSNPKIKAYYIQAGYLISGKIGPGQLQPVARFEEYKPDGADNDTKSWALGLNYYLKGHDAKVMLEYLKVDNQKNASIYSGSAGKDRDAITLAIQFQI